MESTKEKCILHIDVYDNDQRPLVPLKDYDSWLTLHAAAQLRTHVPLLQIAEGLQEHEVPKISCHRRCRSRFTLKWS